jgi:hypothetical protein
MPIIISKLFNFNTLKSEWKEYPCSSLAFACMTDPLATLTVTGVELVVTPDSIAATCSLTKE